MGLEDTSPKIWLFQKSIYSNIIKAYFYILCGRSNLVRLALKMRLKDRRDTLKSRNQSLTTLHKSLESIRNKSLDKYPHFDYGAGYNYQSNLELNLSGFRSTEKRVTALNLTERLLGKTVLDIGSNMGSILFNVRKSIKFGLGVEINEFLVEQSELISNYLKSIEKLKFSNIPFEDLSKNSATFDVILSLANHSTFDGNTKQSLDSYFDKIHGLLNEDGQLIFESHPPEIEPIESLNDTIDLIKKYFITSKIEVKGLDGFLDKDRTYLICKKKFK
jgi:SAM-dependent methyltransferase